MDRRAPILAAALATLLTSSACQDYNFNPVGHCLIQPGTRRVTLSNISTADVLFVVDDSGSMEGEQTRLSNQFDQFVTGLNAANQERVLAGLDPIDFHIAITTTSTFTTAPVLSTPPTCENDCGGAVGSNVCCLGSGAPLPVICRSDVDCDTANGYTCKTSAVCGGAAAVGGSACFGAAPTCAPQKIACDTLHAECANVRKWYAAFTASCVAGYANDLFTNDEYPAGRFMVNPAVADGLDLNKTVLHFDKDLYCNWDAANGVCTDTTPDTAGLNSLVAQFKQNVLVGTCGAGQEQGIEAARKAIQRAQANQQTAGFTTGEFMHGNSKLVVVWVTDEDDCSSPSDPSKAVLFWQTASSDGCEADAALPPEQQREYSTASYADYFTSLGRPFAAAMVASFSNGCNEASCDPGLCCDTACTGNPLVCSSATCGGQGLPSRYLDLATKLRGRGSEVVLGSVCDDFGAAGGTLERIAQIVKPPAGLELPTLPAAGDVTILRIARADGSTRFTCRGPAPVGKTAAQALAEGYDWWFTTSRDQTTDAQKLPTAASKFVYIVNQITNPGSANPCDANPGETYSADYIGQLPAETPTTPGGCVLDSDCSDAMGGSPSEWTCFAGLNSGANPTCIAPTASARGTCICGSRTLNCPNG
jgi:hypothetical protein